MHTVHHPLALGAICVIIGLILRYKVAKRRFNRRNITGLQFYETYDQGLVTRFMEGFARFVGPLLLLVGTVLVLGAWPEQFFRFWMRICSQDKPYRPIVQKNWPKMETEL